MRRVDSLEKTLMLGGIGGRRRRGQQRMRGGHHWLDGHEFEWTPGVGDGQGGLACCVSWGHKESDTTERLNWTEGYGFSCGHVWMWELDWEEGWALKNWCFWTVVLEKTLESPLDCKEIQPVHSEGDQSWVFFGRTGAKAETPVLWPPHAKSWLIGKVSDAGKDWGQVEKGTTGWDGWMASLTRWTWIWVNSGSWWWTGSPGVLQFMGLQSWTRLSDWTELTSPGDSAGEITLRRLFLGISLSDKTLMSPLFFSLVHE